MAENPENHISEDKIRTFNDPIHKTIEIHPLCLKIIDTREFQRLRSLRQCGICHLVFPSAVHTRFEHSIGVYHLAGELLNALKKTTKITAEEDLCVRIAALLHDVGHGPFSHLWEYFILAASKQSWHHESMSLMVIDRLISKPEIKKEFERFNLKDNHVELIKSLVWGKSEEIDPQKLFLFEIVANKNTNIDVDRMDYIRRDSYFFGVICAVHLDRIITYTRVMEVNNQKRIAFRDKIRDDILELFQCRMKMHKICYQHRVCKVLEIMLVDALKAADDYFFSNGMKLSNCHNDIGKFLSLNDSLFDQILFSTDPKLELSRNILIRLQTRQLYSFVGSISLKEKKSRREILDIEENINKRYEIDLIRLCLTDINMGITGNSPFENVVFYDKGNSLTDLNNTDGISSGECKLLVFTVDKVDKKISETWIQGINELLHNNNLNTKA